ncbi:hypothetical protein B1M_05461, partial [Burkholderia sp. TJI49]
SAASNWADSAAMRAAPLSRFGIGAAMGAVAAQPWAGGRDGNGA